MIGYLYPLNERTSAIDIPDLYWLPRKASLKAAEIHNTTTDIMRTRINFGFICFVV